MRVIVVFLYLITFGFSAVADMPSEPSKIDYLLSQLASSDVIFIRNGEEHTGAWGRNHLLQKMKEADKPNMTAEEFITTIASASSQTGKSYFIRSKDGKAITAQEWLRGKLKMMPVL